MIYYFVLLLGCILLALCAYFDYYQPVGVAAGIPYILIIGLGMLIRSKTLVVLFGGCGIALSVIGYMLSTGDNTLIAFLNRGMIITTLVITTIGGCYLLAQQSKMHKELLAMANTDHLTGINSRRPLMEELARRVKESHRYEVPLSVLILDIDYFKGVNDHYGHIQGDSVIKAVSQHCQTLLRETDFIGRYGGEEFMIICPYTLPADAFTVAERLRTSVANLAFGNVPALYNVTVSIGVSWVQHKEMNSTALLEAADTALYQAKEMGRNKSVLYENPAQQELGIDS